MPIIDNDFFNTHMTQLGLKQSFSPKEEQLDELIIEASEWIENYLRRHVVIADIAEPIRGRGFQRLMLDHWPVTELTSIEFDDDNGISGTVDTSLVRVLSSGILEWKKTASGPWRKERTYNITYSAGMDPIPSTIKRATALKVVDLFQPQYQGARDTRSVEFISNIEAMIVDLLETYRRDRLG